MTQLRKMLRRIVDVPAALVILCTAVSGLLLAKTFVSSKDDGPVAYIAYGLAAYALLLVCVKSVKVSLKLKDWLCRYPLIRRLMQDIPFRLQVGLNASFAANLLYAGMNAISGIYYRSAWSGTLAAYYFLLSMMRFFLLRDAYKAGFGRNMAMELKRYRQCGVFLIMMNSVMAGMVVLVLHQEGNFEYAGSLIYAMAFYTFYITISSVVNVIKYRKYKSPAMSAAKIISLIAALVSMLSLETAMISRFNDAQTSPYFRQVMITATGGVVCIVSMVIGVFMIVHATKQICKNDGAKLYKNAEREKGMEENKERFDYTYSAKQQEEIKNIREKYLPQQASKVDEIRQLDHVVTRKGTILSITIGIIGCLVLGVGMCCAMVWMDILFVPGIIIGLVGIGMIAVAYPLYNAIVKKEREKLAPKILALIDEVLNSK